LNEAALRLNNILRVNAVTDIEFNELVTGHLVLVSGLIVGQNQATNASPALRM